MSKSFDPPDFDALADRPELRRTVMRVLSAGSVGNEPEPHIPWETTKQVADELLLQRDLRLKQLDAGIVFLPVTDLWTFTARPGCLLASLGWANDSEQVKVVIRAAFESGLDA